MAFLLLASPLMMAVLRLDGIGPAILVAVAAVPLTITGAQLGVLQGERRWSELSLIYVTLGVSRLVLGVGLLAWRPTEFMAMLSVTLGLVVTALLGLYLLRGRTRARTGERPALGSRRRHRGAPERLRAARVLRAVERRRDHRQERALRRVGGPVRRGADRDQGGAVPAAVRGDHLLPDAVRRLRSPSRTDRQPGRRRRARPAQYGGRLPPALAGPPLRRWRSLQRDRRRAVDVRARRHGPLGGAAAAVLRARPPRPQRHLVHLGGARAC